jgi:hypothetical protein
MIEHILSNNNERCYSNFSTTFREVNTSLMQAFSSFVKNKLHGKVNVWYVSLPGNLTNIWFNAQDGLDLFFKCLV